MRVAAAGAGEDALPESSPRRGLGEALRYAQAGTELVIPMVVLGGGGYLLDRRFRTGPWLLLAGLLRNLVLFRNPRTSSDHLDGP